MVLGAGGFLFPFVCPKLLSSLPLEVARQIELPNSLGSIKVAAPDGRVFIVSEPSARIQRYGPAGFELGFEVDSQGRSLQAGVTERGEIVVCAVRLRQLLTYTADGLEVGERMPCNFDKSGHGRILTASHFTSRAVVPEIATGWLAAILIPLWHPFVAWVILVAGGVWLKRMKAAPEPAQQRAQARPGEAT
jgi:hypothetical protein